MSWVFFFDGDCAFCSQSVQTVLRLDRERRISFAPLQGAFAAEKGFTKYASAGNGTMVLLRESDGQVFLRSDALIELARALGGSWWIFTIARFVPKPWRDWIYGRVAANRHRLIGKSDHCSLPDPELLRRLRE